VSLTGLTNGNYTYRVTIVLSDGGTATGTATFTVNTCWSSTTGEPDLKLTGTLNHPNSGTTYTSTDGTCSGRVTTLVWIVQGATPFAASIWCQVTQQVVSLSSEGYSTAPPDYYECVG
jgi:hypothetical protein